MSKKNIYTTKNEWLIYILISIPLTFTLIIAIENEYEIILWIHFAILGAAALFYNDNKATEKKTKFSKKVDHVFYVFVLPLIFLGIWYFFTKAF